MATAAPPAPPVPPTPLVNNQAHLYRLLNLTVDEGTSIVRQIFDEKRLSYKPGLDLNAFLTQEKSTIQNNKQIQSYLKDKLFPKNGTPPTHSLEDFDLTLLVSLLRNISSLGLQGPWKNEPKPGEEKPEDDLRRLQIMRNGLAHTKSTTGISEQDFQSKWSDTEDVLIRLNKSLNNPDLNLQQRIEECKTKPLDSVGLDQRIESLQTSITDDLKGIKTDIGILTIKTEGWISTLDKKIEKIRTNQEQQKTPDESSAKQKAEDEYQETKEKLKEELAYLHKQEHHTIPLSPLFEELDTPLFDFYVMPGLMENDWRGKTALKSLLDFFKSGSTFCNEIYVAAEGGFGKTAFSKYLTVLWCQAHFPDATHTEHLNKESVNAMHEFEFLFLVLLRDSPDVCSIDELISIQIIQNLSRPSSYNKQCLEEILHRERCLVVLDGLDEWTHPDTICGKKDKSIPHRNARENCTIMTTTRPWKLSTLRLCRGPNDKLIALTNLEPDSILELTMRALKKIKCKTDQVDMDIAKEAGKLLNRYHDFEQVSVPLLLIYVICLWCDNIPVEQTKCGLYASIIELLLSRYVNKYKKLSQTKLPQGVSDIPQCFSEQEHCKAYFTFLTSLGELAFKRLISKPNETRLVFDSSVAKECLKEDVIEQGRLTGIITQTKQTTLTSQMRKTSFSHKTVQEFLAALYISSCSDQDKVVTEVLEFCNSIQDILDLSKVFIFISGINAKLFSSLSSELIKVINYSEITSECRSMTFERREPVREIQDLFVSCIKEIPDHKDFKVCLHDFLFDVKCDQKSYYRNLQRLALQNKNNIRSICIVYPVYESAPPVHVYVNMSSDRKYKEEEIVSLLSTSVQYLHIFGIKPDYALVYGIKKGREKVITSLTDEQCKTFQNSSQLETIHILNSTVSHHFLNFCINIKSIKEIHLFELSCSDRHVHYSCPGIIFDLSQHSELRVLQLGKCHITLCCMKEDKSLLLHNMRNIEHVRLEKVKMSGMLLRRLVEIMEQLKHSVRVLLEGCDITPREEFVNIRDYICSSKRFKVLTDWRNHDSLSFETKK